MHTLSEVPNITSSFQDERDHLVGEENLTYSCEFEGFPLPSVVFYFNGVPILANNTSGVITVNNILTIPSPQASHSGIYQCIVRNKFGDDQRAWVLEIRKPSEFSYPGILESNTILYIFYSQSCLKCSHTTSQNSMHLMIET